MCIAFQNMDYVVKFIFVITSIIFSYHSCAADTIIYIYLYVMIYICLWNVYVIYIFHVCIYRVVNVMTDDSERFRGTGMGMADLHCVGCLTKLGFKEVIKFGLKYISILWNGFLFTHTNILYIYIHIHIYPIL